MDEQYRKERFETLKIKSTVAEKFRGFSRSLSKSQSMTLLLMIDFFEDNGISPAESMGSRMETLETRISMLIKKRINGMIAIMKDIEKSQTKPTVAMLYSLFEQTEPPKKKLILEKKRTGNSQQVQYRERSTERNKAEDQWKR